MMMMFVARRKLHQVSAKYISLVTKDILIMSNYEAQQLQYLFLKNTNQATPNEQVFKENLKMSDS